MNTKKKILIGILIVVILVGGGWWIWNVEMQKINCSEITSMHWGKLCVGQEVRAIGTLECYPEYPDKAGIHYLKFENNTELKFLEEIPDCEKYQHQKIEVMGYLYKCEELDQCAGIGLKNIKWVNSIPGNVVVATDKTKYKQEETIEIKVANNSNEDICFESCNPYYFDKKMWNGIWKSFNKECEVSFITDCIEPGQTKIFEETANELAEFTEGGGVYRVVVPVWSGCENLEEEGYEYTDCKSVTGIYSDEFTIK